MEDASLMKQIAGGDEAALQALLRRYGPLIRYILRPILSDQRDREECYADISLKIWQTAGSFDETKGTLKAWLTVLSRNSALNHARRRTEADVPLEENMPHEAGSAEEALLRRERQAKLKAVITALPPEGIFVTIICRSIRQPTAQMAAELCLTERAVEGRLYRLRQRLRAMLGGDFCE